MQARSQTRRAMIGWGLAAGAGLLAAPFPVLAWDSELPADRDRTAAEPAPTELAPTELATATSPFDHVIASVTINGQGPFRFLVDTGANTSCVSLELAARLALPPGPSVKVNTIVGPKARASVVLDRLEVGTRVRRKVRAAVLPMANFGIDGVLGVDWLKGQRLVFGFSAKTLEITRSRAETSAEGRVVVPARRRSGQLTIVDADLSGRRISAMIDSGSQFSLGNPALRRIVEQIDRKAAKDAVKVRLETVAGESFGGEQLYLPFLRLGGLTLGNVPVVFADMPVFGLWGLRDQPAILLGIDLLAQFTTVALDFGRSAVRFDVDPETRA